MILRKKDRKKKAVAAHSSDEDAGAQQKTPDEPEGMNAMSEGEARAAEQVAGDAVDEADAKMQPQVDRKQEDEPEETLAEPGEEDRTEVPSELESAEPSEDGDEDVPEVIWESEGDDLEEEEEAPSLTEDIASGPVLAELIATRAELKRVETERLELIERLARRQAEFENYRKRLERERGETYQRLVGDVVSKLLPVMDNMRRALEAEASVQANESEEFKHFLLGVELIFKQLHDLLEQLGVKPVPAVGQPFDPHVHEAVAIEQRDDYEPDMVTQELVRGYRLGEKLLRPAMVKVSTRE
jgi:molecular chaperone GrpE